MTEEFSKLFLKECFPEDSLLHLHEVAPEDRFTKGFNKFLEKYSERLPKGLQKGNVFVRFAISAQNIMNLQPKHGDPAGIYAYPLDYVVNHPADIRYGSGMEWIHVLKAKIRPFLLTGLTSYTARMMIKNAGADYELFKKMYNKFKRDNGYNERPLARAFFFAIQHDGPDPEKDLLSGTIQRKRFLKAGIKVLADNGKDQYRATINQNEPEQILFMTKDTYEVVETFYVGGGERYSKNVTSSRHPNQHIAKKLVASIAKQLGVKFIRTLKRKHDTELYRLGTDYVVAVSYSLKNDKSTFFKTHRELGRDDEYLFQARLYGPDGNAYVKGFQFHNVDEIAEDVIKQYKTKPDKSKTSEDFSDANVKKKDEEDEKAKRQEEREKEIKDFETIFRIAKNLGFESQINPSTYDDIKEIGIVVNGVFYGKDITGKKKPWFAKEFRDYIADFEKAEILDKNTAALSRKLTTAIIEAMEKKGVLGKDFNWKFTLGELDRALIKEKQKNVKEYLEEAFSDELEQPPRYHYHSKVEKVDPKELKKFMEYPDRPIKPKLLENIKKYGIREPLILDYDPHSKKVLLVEGNHRLKIALQLGLEWVPVTVLRINENGKYPKPNVEQKGVVVSGYETKDKYGYVPGDLKPSQIGIPSMGKAEEPPKKESTLKESPDATSDATGRPLAHHHLGAVAFAFLNDALIWDRDHWGNHPHIAEALLKARKALMVRPNVDLRSVLRKIEDGESLRFDKLTMDDLKTLRSRINQIKPPKLSDDNNFQWRNAYRKAFDYPGRYWSKDQIISFWAKQKDVPIAIIDKLMRELKPAVNKEEVRFEFIDSKPGYKNMATYDDLKSNRSNVVKMSKEEEQERLSKLHTTPPGKLTAQERQMKLARGKGFGSDKKRVGNLSMTQLRQLVRTSECLEPDPFFL